MGAIVIMMMKSIAAKIIGDDIELELRALRTKNYELEQRIKRLESDGTFASHRSLLWS